MLIDDFMLLSCVRIDDDDDDVDVQSHVSSRSSSTRPQKGSMIVFVHPRRFL